MEPKQHAFNLSGFQRDLLYIIAGHHKPSGQAICRELEQWINVGHGQLYTNLDSLAEQSLIEKGSKDQRTNYYTITEAGLAVLQHRREWEDGYLNDIMAGTCIRQP
jgi:DNA-binding PadR family transcriptional regulator